MDDWLARFAAALGEGLPAGAPAVDLGPEGEQAVLDLAAVVANATGADRALLASFLAGAYVALRAAEGADAAKALDEVVRVARRLPPVERKPGTSGTTQVPPGRSTT